MFDERLNTDRGQAGARILSVECPPEMRLGPSVPTPRIWMMRKGWDYEQLKKFGSHAGQPGTGYGVK
jgi:hypothetical protein